MTGTRWYWYCDDLCNIAQMLPVLGSKVRYFREIIQILRVLGVFRAYYIMDMLGDTLDNVDRGCVYQR